MTDYSTAYANNIFEQPWWLDIVAPGSWKETVSRGKDGKVQARAVFVHDHKKVFMPEFTQTLGIWMDSTLQADYGRQKTIIYELFEEINTYRDISFLNAYCKMSYGFIPMQITNSRVFPMFPY